MGNQRSSLVLTVEKKEFAGEIVSSASLARASGASAGAGESGIAIMIPGGIETDNEFYLYLPAHQKALIRSGIRLVQDEIWNYQRTVIPMKSLIEQMIHKLNTATAQSEEAISRIIGLGEQKSTLNAPDTPKVSGTSKIYKCRVLDDCKQVEMKKVCSSTYSLLRDESLSRGAVLKTKIDWSSDVTDQCSTIDWETIFKLLQTVKSSQPQRSAIQKCVEMQQQIDQLKIVFDEMEPQLDRLGESEVVLVHKNHSERQELQTKIAAACSEILFGR